MASEQEQHSVSGTLFLSVSYLCSISKCELASFSSTVSHAVGRAGHQLPQLSNFSGNRKFFNSGKESFLLGYVTVHWMNHC